MPVRSSDFEARLAGLEAYVGTPKEPRGMTLTARIEAQHRMLIALNENQSETNRRLTGIEERMTGAEGRLAGVEGRLTGVEGRLTLVEGRLNNIEGTTVLVLHRLTGIEHRLTGIEHLLRPPDDPDEGPSLNGTRIPLN